MRLRSLFVLIAPLFLIPMMPAVAQYGIITKPSNHSASATLDRLEAALKERGFTIFTGLITPPLRPLWV
jgi:hypothetical protein